MGFAITTGTNSFSNYPLILVQILSIAAALGVILVGGVQLNGSGNLFGVTWCEVDKTDTNGQAASRHDCWASNFNKIVALSYYSIALIILGVVAFITEMRIKQYNRIPGFLCVCGAFALGAAANTGIVLGSLAMFIGTVQIVLVFLGHRNGPIVFNGDYLSPGARYFIQLMAAVAGLAVAAVGIMCCVAVGHNGSGVVGLQWCNDDAAEYCWLGISQSDYALGSYGASLLVLGILAAALDFKVVQQAESLQGWNVLGPLYIILGGLCLGAVGNTGIIVGSFSMFVGFVLLSVAVLYDQQLGYNSLSA